jgi:hypothetical protein
MGKSSDFGRVDKKVRWKQPIALRGYVSKRLGTLKYAQARG